MKETYKKVLFTFIPIRYIITILLAFLLRAIGGEWILLSNILVNVCLFFLATKLSVVVHETGHAVIADLVGGTPKRIVLGMHNEVARFYFRKVKIVVNSTMRSGLAFSAFDNTGNIRLKLLAYSLGGIIFNFCLAGVLFLLFGFDENVINGQSGISPSTVLIISNVLMGIGNLFPFYSSHAGQKHASDGLSILKIPFYKKSELNNLRLTTHQLDTYDLIEEKKFSEAIEKINELKKMSSEMKILDLHTSICYLKLGDIENSLSILLSMSATLEEEDYESYKPYYFNALAWIYLISENHQLADDFSKKAKKLAPSVEAIIGTRAAVLIDMGKVRDGEALIRGDIDFNFPNGNSITDSAYLAYTFHRRNQKKISDQYKEFVIKNIDKLDFDEKMLVERVLSKLEV